MSTIIALSLLVQSMLNLVPYIDYGFFFYFNPHITMTVQTKYIKKKKKKKKAFSFWGINILLHLPWGCCARVRMVVGFTTTNAISAYHH
jgi:hypothetical protein